MLEHLNRKSYHALSMSAVQVGLYIIMFNQHIQHQPTYSNSVAV